MEAAQMISLLSLLIGSLKSKSTSLMGVSVCILIPMVCGNACGGFFRAPAGEKFLAVLGSAFILTQDAVSDGNSGGATGVYWKPW